MRLDMLANIRWILAVPLLFVAINAACLEEPPYSGTVYIDSEWITPADSSSYLGKSYQGVTNFTWYDWSSREWIISDAYTYQLTFSEGVTVRASVHIDFAKEPTSLLDDWGRLLGQTPTRLLSRLGEFQVVPDSGQSGTNLQANGWTDPTHIVLYGDDPVGYYEYELATGWVEEIILHELGHAAFQPQHQSPEWVAAQNSDPCFISTYAASNSQQEDVSETLMPYLMLRFMPDRVDASDASKIRHCIGERSQVLDQWLGEGAWTQYSFLPWEKEQEQEDPVVGLPIWLLYLATQQANETSVDSDLDGVDDRYDACPNTPQGEPVDASGCSDSQI